MSASNRRVVAITWAAFGVPVMFAMFVYGGYRSSLADGLLPHAQYSGWELAWWAVYLVALVSGLASVWTATRARLPSRGALCVAYVLVMGGLLPALHIWVACHFGDCV